MRFCLVRSLKATLLLEITASFKVERQQAAILKTTPEPECNMHQSNQGWDFNQRPHDGGECHA